MYGYWALRSHNSEVELWPVEPRPANDSWFDSNTERRLAIEEGTLFARDELEDFDSTIPGIYLLWQPVAASKRFRRSAICTGQFGEESFATYSDGFWLMVATPRMAMSLSGEWRNARWAEERDSWSLESGPQQLHRLQLRFQVADIWPAAKWHAPNLYLRSILNFPTVKVYWPRAVFQHW